MRVEVFRGADGWYYRHVSDNNERLDVSEAHEHRTDALEMAHATAPEGAEVVVLED
jgi:hypothetical protein